MRPVLVTGARGFVGRHLLAELGDRAVAAEANVTDAGELGEEVRAVAPAAVVHLAALSSVGASWRGAGEVWRVNAVGTVNLLDAVAAEQPAARILFASTGEVYGAAATAAPTPEDAEIAPVSPYAASKAAAEIACLRAVRVEGLDVVVARAFPHVGPGQREDFAVGSWTAQIARLEAEGGGTLLVGDLAVERDLTDVRDVCCAYRLLLERDVPAGVYNVASGRALPLERVVELLVGMARTPVEVQRDPARLRPADVAVLCGDPSRLEAATGWRAEIPLGRSLADALEEARRASVRQASPRA